MAIQRLNKNQTSEDAYSSGQIAATTGAGVKPLYPVMTVGMTFDGTSTFTIVTKGIYHIHAQQLQANGASAVYLAIQVNGVATRHAYLPGSLMADLNVSDLRELNVGDTVRFYQQNATSSAWAGEHSGYQIFLVKRT